MRRSRTHRKLGQLEPASADLQRAVAAETDPSGAFDELRMAEDWSSASAVWLATIGGGPDGINALVEACRDAREGGGSRGLREVVRHIADQKSPTEDAQDSGRATKICLLQPDAIDVARIPSERFERELDQGAGTTQWRIWAWAARTLLAYRQGDLAAALQYSDNALTQGNMANERQHALVLAVRAWALAGLERHGEAEADMAKSQEILENELQSLDPRSLHDVYMPLILIEEAESLVVPRQNRLRE